MRSRLRHRRVLAVGVALGVFAGLALGIASPALADTIGGTGLDGTHRTVDLLPGAQPLPDIWADEWIISDMTTGQVLAAKGAHVARPPASTLKTLMALTVLPQTTPAQTYVATSYATGIYGSRVGMRTGKTYTLDELWYAAFLPSANDAAIGLAQANGGVEHTVRQMNDVAARLQAGDTVAKTPNGLDTPGQVSSVYDLSLIARAGMQRPDFAKYAGTARAMFPNSRGRGSHPIYTTNRLLLHGYRGMIGVKTGFTSRAGRTYIGAAKRQGTTLLIALMGIHESSETAARKLLDWGFANHDKVTPIGVLVDPLPDATTVPTAASGTAPTAGASASGPSAGGTPAARTDATSALTLPAPTGITTAVLWGAGIVGLGAAVAWGASRIGRHRTGVEPTS